MLGEGQLMQRVMIHSPNAASGLHHRRTARRIPSTVAVEILAPRKGSGVLLNASTGGARVAVDCELVRGELCHVRLVGRSGIALVDSLRVVWAREVADGWIAGLARLPLD